MSCRVHVIVLIAIVNAVIAADIKPKDEKTVHSFQYMNSQIGDKKFQTYQTNRGVVGVSSIAGITARNGRLSSVSGVKFYPGIQAPVVASSVSTDLRKGIDSKINYPVSTRIIKSEDGKYASSSIRVSPGSVSVSSIARSAPLKSGESNSLPNFSSGFASLNTPLQPQFKSYRNSPFLQNPFDTRHMNSWFPNYMFTPYPTRTGLHPGFINPVWQYPSFPIINYWQ